MAGDTEKVTKPRKRVKKWYKKKYNVLDIATKAWEGEIVKRISKC